MGRGVPGARWRRNCCLECVMTNEIENSDAAGHLLTPLAAYVLPGVLALGLMVIAAEEIS
jgi:hypothetical protein